MPSEAMIPMIYTAWIISSGVSVSAVSFTAVVYMYIPSETVLSDGAGRFIRTEKGISIRRIIIPQSTGKQLLGSLLPNSFLTMHTRIIAAEADSVI